MVTDGLEEVVLSRDWLGNEPGTAVRVDPQRAKWLREHNYGEQAGGPIAIEAVASRSTRRNRRAQRDESVAGTEPEPITPEPIEGEES